MLKHFYLLLIFLSFSINLSAQDASISTKFSQDGNLFENADKFSNPIAKFKENEKCIVTAYLGNYTYKIKYKDLIGFVKDQFLIVNEQMMDLYFDHEEKQRLKAIEEKKKRQEKIKKIQSQVTEKEALIEQRRLDSIATMVEEKNRKITLLRKNDSIAQTLKEQNRLFEEKQKKDSIAKVIEQESMQLELKRKNDSIAKELEKQRTVQRKKDSTLQATREQNRLFEEKQKKDSIAKEIEKQRTVQRQKDSTLQAIREQNRLFAEKQKKDSIAKVIEQKRMQLELKRRNDSIAKELEKQHIAQRKKDSTLQAIREQNRLFEEKQKNDSIAKVIEQKRMQLELKRKNDSIAKAELEKQRIAQRQKDSTLQAIRKQNRLFEEKQKKDSIANIIEQRKKIVVDQAVKKQNEELVKKRRIDSLDKAQEKIIKANEIAEKIKFRNTCHYQINEYDDFYKEKFIVIEPYDIAENLTAVLFRRGSSINLFLNLAENLGCASYLPNQRSSAKVTLENNQTIMFYHSWDIDCGNFGFKGKLSKDKIAKLKASPIKSITLKGTKSSAEITKIDYREFFIDKLKCIE